MSGEFDDARLQRLLEKVEELAKMVEMHDKTLFGEYGELGMAHQMKLMWRLHIWVMCSLSALAGSIITASTIYLLRLV